jgi:hypothetical protein
MPFQYGDNPNIPIAPWQQAASTDTPLDYAGRQAKQFLKKWGRGDDISSYGQFNVISQNAAAQRQQAQDAGGTGAAALMSAQGGDQELLQRAATDKSINQINQQEGMAKTAALANTAQQETGQFDTSRAEADMTDRFNKSAYMQMLQTKYPSTFQKTFWDDPFGNLLSMVAQNGATIGKAAGMGA